MGIKFRCQTCNKKLHVKAFLAGKKGLCPKCGGKIRIPELDAALDGGIAASPATPVHPAAERPVLAESVPHRDRAQRSAASEPASGPAGSRASGRAVAATTAGDPIDEAPNAVWYVRPPTGGQFGPADAAIMRRWLGEGRVSADALVWREGWSDWKSAGPLFPSLLPTPASVPSSASLLPSDGPVSHRGPAVTERKGAATLGAKRSPYARPTHTVRNVLMITALGMLCIVLFVFLYIVLRNQA
jgi:hypothetical protein